MLPWAESGRRRARSFLMTMAALVAVSIAAVTVAHAAGSFTREDVDRADRDMRAAVAQIEDGEYQAGIDRLMRIYNGVGADADALNYLGFAHRKLGNWQESLKFYEEALELDPDHLQANEYLGELFIQTGEIGLAERQLAKLERLCGQCEEHRQLQAALAKSKGLRSDLDDESELILGNW